MKAKKINKEKSPDNKHLIQNNGDKVNDKNSFCG